jgi:exosome complex exonuclease DIS3/RRP44
VELLKEEEWVCPSEIVLEDEGVGDENVDDVATKEDELKKATKRKSGAKPTGKVVGIVRRKWRQYCGILQGGIDGVYQLFVPADKSIPKIKIETRQAEFLRTQKLIVTIDSWPKHSRYPHVRHNLTFLELLNQKKIPSFRVLVAIYRGFYD